MSMQKLFTELVATDWNTNLKISIGIRSGQPAAVRNVSETFTKIYQHNICMVFISSFLYSMALKSKGN